ncbi:hypothetical protein [Streptomyces sp. SYSU K21746]
MSDDTIWLRMLPGETPEEFTARIVAARPPLDAQEKAELRAIFRPLIEQDAAARKHGEAA